MTVRNVHKTVQHKLSWVILLCLNHIAGGVQFSSPGCDMYTFPLGGGASTEANSSVESLMKSYENKKFSTSYDVITRRKLLVFI